jgi:hypothetical protein
MPKLNQIIAIEKGVKNDSYKKLTEAHKRLQKPALLSGLSRTYRPRDDEGEQLPPESTRVQLRAEQTIQETGQVLTELFNITATKDFGNCEARADVVVDGKVVLEQVPVTYLLFLEKQIVDLKTFIQKLPILDQADHWEYDQAQDCWATPPVETTRNKKILRNHVKAEATEHHPAQVEVYSEDMVVGYWKTLKYSGALPAARVHELLTRIEKLAQAVKFAREEANSTEVKRVRTGEAFFGYLFAA